MSLPDRPKAQDLPDRSRAERSAPAAPPSTSAQPQHVNCWCRSYNRQTGSKPEVALPKPAWSDRHGDTIMVDECIADTVTAIWDAGYITLSSCCGHGRGAPSLVIGGSSDGTPEIISAMEQIIAEVDGRTFRLHQWQLVEVSPRPPSEPR